MHCRGAMLFAPAGQGAEAKGISFPAGIGMSCRGMALLAPAGQGRCGGFLEAQCAPGERGDAGLCPDPPGQPGPA